MKAVLLAHLAATLFMTGVIWFVQIVHYPLFNQVSNSSFSAYAEAHGRLTTWIVAPVMLIELITGLLLFWRRPEAISVMLVVSGLSLLVLIWFSTWLIQVPRHQILASGFDPDAHRALILTNWLRTLGWSVRSLIVLWMVGDTMKV